MKKPNALFHVLASVVASTMLAPHAIAQSPADHLPAHITRLTSFGERPDWSADGKKLLFLSKTFGDAMELDLSTRSIRNLTAHYPHYGYTRAMYLANGDILLAGPETFDTRNPNAARRNCFLYLLDRNASKPAAALGARCNEGPAVSRRRLHIAWTEWTDPKPGEGNTAFSKMYEADITYDGGTPALSNRRLILDGATLPMRCTMETQNFRPPAERELIFSAYTDGGRYCDVLSIDLDSNKVTFLTKTPDEYDEPEGIYPDGLHTLVEGDKHNRKGSGYIDLWKLKLDGSEQADRLTHFSDYPGYKASNPVVSDDGRFIAFQLGRTGDAAGVGHGIFLYDIAKAAETPR